MWWIIWLSQMLCPCGFIFWILPVLVYLYSAQNHSSISIFLWQGCCVNTQGGWFSNSKLPQASIETHLSPWKCHTSCECCRWPRYSQIEWLVVICNLSEYLTCVWKCWHNFCKWGEQLMWTSVLKCRLSPKQMKSMHRCFCCLYRIL